ncbi:hypothetical protein MMC21_004255 [Puttea exsequens]|nr:hypothetical protein [Puttea exsequens]
MGIVDYSESEGSDQEENSAPQEPPKPKTNPDKPAFQKVVDRSDPHKIKVSLPEKSRASAGEGGEDESERPTKRPRIAGGGLSGFNALLPAPKRPLGVAGETFSNGARSRGLGSGVNLRTGAAPGFSREPEPTLDMVEDNDSPLTGPGTKTGEDEVDARNDKPSGKAGLVKEKLVQPVKPKGKTMFKPLSVPRKPQKKKVLPPEESSSLKATNGNMPQEKKLAPKASLFSVADSSNLLIDISTQKGPYQPMVYDANNADPSLPQSSTDQDAGQEETLLPPLSNGPADPQSLSTIATDLNLSASAKRQLLGRQSHKTSSTPINLINFNTDAEYAANEAMRQAGEVVQHNAVRAIAPGKHSLKQLVSAASNQKDALEESFASGRRNKKEAGSKYGW